MKKNKTIKKIFYLTLYISIFQIISLDYVYANTSNNNTISIIIREVAKFLLPISVIIIFVVLHNKSIKSEKDDELKILGNINEQEQKKLKNEAYDVFLKFLEATNNNDVTNLNEILTHKMHKIYSKQIFLLKEKQRKKNMDDIYFIDSVVTKYEKNDYATVLNMKIKIISTNYTLDKNNKILKGYLDKKIQRIYEVEFIKNSLHGMKINKIKICREDIMGFK